MEIVGVV